MPVRRKASVKRRQSQTTPKCKRLEFAEGHLHDIQELEKAIKDLSDRAEMMRRVLEDFINDCKELE